MGILNVNGKALTSLLSLIFIKQAYSLKTNLVDRCATESEKFTETDFFPDKAKLKDATTFSITYHGTYKVITNLAQDEKYLLYQCGFDVDELSINTTQYRIVTSVPLPDGLALTSTVQVPLMELLDLRQEIKTYIGADEYISSSCVNDMLDDGTIDVVPSNEIVPYDPDDPGTELWKAQWEAKYPDRVIIDSSIMTSAGQGTDKTMFENAYMEGPAQANFEWIYFYAALFNKEKTAKKLIKDASKLYDCTEANVKFTFGQQNNAVKPTAIWAYYSNYPGYEGWFSASCTPKSNYQCEYAKSCNMDLKHTSAFMTDSQFVAFAKDADIFFYSSNNWADFYTPGRKKAVLDQLKSVQNKRVFDTERSGEKVWFEQRHAEYDVVLEDMCTVAGMTTNNKPHDRLYFRNVFTETIGEREFDVCTDRAAPFVSRADKCKCLDQEDCDKKCNGKSDKKKKKKCKKKCKKKNKKKC